jgi:hypothetical protein
MNWDEFAEKAPEMVRQGEERFQKTGLALLGTVRRDGSARISPLEPLIAHGKLYLGMMGQSKKALDLLRDPRCLVHSVVANKHGTDGEFKLRGTAVEIADPDERERFCQAEYEHTGWRPEEPYHVFALDIGSAVFVIFEDGEKQVQTWSAQAAGAGR